MSRTVHHIPYRHRDSAHDDDGHYERIGHSSLLKGWIRYMRRYKNLPRESATLWDLRYTDREIRAAEREGRRPQPQKKRHVLAMYREHNVQNRKGMAKRYSKKVQRGVRTRERADLIRAAYDPEFVVEPGMRTVEYDLW
ncbi:hypothetical protein [Streptomyces sp. 5-10]|uniref:hypothetical protein n=1 Tax=Streptomyces sp. 5-10 TaxID=878925 RepID=UPI00168AEB73|nr:hypothetical protein [Streptomyces sp. 5-10]MBD3004746.1 hypothetical protein [Streptomyces sp. 5-10]